MEVTTRVVVYVPQDAHRKLKSKLALLNQSMSDWFRQHVEEELKSGEKNFLKKNPEKDVEEDVSVPSEGHICEWDRASKCKSPATTKKGNKWFCVPHSIQ
jgi:hypothetical protein